MQAFKPTEDMITAATAVFQTMALVGIIEPVVRAYQRKILAKHQWHIARRWTEGESRKCHDDKIILDPEQAYLIEEKYFRTYHEEQNQERIKAGLYVDDPEKCPLLVAKHLEAQAKRLLLETMEPISKLSPDKLLCSGMKNYEEMVDLSLKLLAPFIDTEKAKAVCFGK